MPGLFRIEHRLPDIDLHQLLIRVDALELCPDRGGVLVNLAEPERSLAGWLEHLVQIGRLGQPVAVEVDGASVMLPVFGVEPVAANEVAVGIEACRRSGWGELLSRCRYRPSPSS